MKTADLVVGDEYLVSSSDDWLIRGSYTPERRRVLDTGKWLRAHYYTASNRYHNEVLEDGTTVSVREQVRRRLTGRSDGVLTVRVDEDGKPMTFADGKEQIDVTPARDIRGAWEEASAIRERNLSHAKEKAEREHEARVEYRARKEAVLTTLGVNEITPFNKQAVSILLDDLEAIVAAVVAVNMQFPTLDRKDS